MTPEEKIATMARKARLTKQQLVENVEIEEGSEKKKYVTTQDSIIESKEVFFKSLIEELLKESITQSCVNDKIEEVFSKVRVKGVNLYNYCKKEIAEDLTSKDLEEHKEIIKEGLFNKVDEFVNQMITNNSSKEYSTLKENFVAICKNDLTTSEDNKELSEDESQLSMDRAMSLLVSIKLIEELSDFIVNKKEIMSGVKASLKK